jgi:hypothetical protein
MNFKFPLVLLFLGILAISPITISPSYALTENITLRSDSSHTMLVGPAGVPFPNAFTPADFAAASSGPNAFEITNHNAWVPHLSVDPTGKYIGTANVNPNDFGPNFQLVTALYAVNFEITSASIDSATLDIHFLVDNNLGWIATQGFGGATNEGIFINGQPVVGTTLPISICGFCSEHSFTGLDISGLVNPGTNTLYVYVSDYGQPSGLQYLANITVESTPVPPPFSNGIPNANPLVTCLQGHFNPQAPTHYWFIKAEQTGTLTVDVRATAVNPTGESGSVIANLFDGATNVGSVTVFHPTGLGPNPGDENIGFITISATGGTIYRLELQLGPPVNLETMQAHHYKISTSGVSTDVGVSSITHQYSEHVSPGELYYVNVVQGENFVLNFITESPDHGANQATQVTVEIRDGTNTLLYGPTTLSLPLPPSVTPINIPNVNAGTLKVLITADGHYRLDKTSGTDHGIYYDTCPLPPPPPPPGEAKTIGYWKNHESDTQSKLPKTLGSYIVGDLDTALGILDDGHAKNAHDMLAAQLLAAKLNVASNVPSACVASAISDADAILSAAGYAGPGTTTAPKGAAKEAVNAVKDTLDNFNNNGCS